MAKYLHLFNTVAEFEAAYGSTEDRVEFRLFGTYPEDAWFSYSYTEVGEDVYRNDDLGNASLLEGRVPQVGDTVWYWNAEQDREIVEVRTVPAQYVEPWVSYTEENSAVTYNKRVGICQESCNVTMQMEKEYEGMPTGPLKIICADGLHSAWSNGRNIMGYLYAKDGSPIGAVELEYSNSMTREKPSYCYWSGTYENVPQPPSSEYEQKVWVTISYDAEVEGDGITSAGYEWVPKNNTK